MSLRKEQTGKKIITDTGPFLNKNGEKNLNSNMIVVKSNIFNAVAMSLVPILWFGICVTIYNSMNNGESFTVLDTVYSSPLMALQENPFLYSFLIVPILGLFTVYMAVCGWVNETRYIYDGVTLVKVAGPLPFFSASYKINRSDITQAYVLRCEFKQEETIDVNYRVYAIDQTKNERILYSADNYDEARIFEQWIESRLQIKDISTPGEWKQG